jgi:hypothetical protein
LGYFTRACPLLVGSAETLFNRHFFALRWKISNCQFRFKHCRGILLLNARTPCGRMEDIYPSASWL